MQDTQIHPCVGDSGCMHPKPEEYCEGQVGWFHDDAKKVPQSVVRQDTKHEHTLDEGGIILRRSGHDLRNQNAFQDARRPRLGLKTIRRLRPNLDNL